jgi:hypothetical protein
LSKTEGYRIAKNFLQSVIAGIAYAVSVNLWFPNANGVIISIITSIVIIGNAMDPVDNMRILKKQGIIAIIALICIILLAEVLRNSEGQQWWQNVLVQSVVTVAGVRFLEGAMPKLNYYSIKKIIKDFIMSIINSVGVYTALTTLEKNENYYSAIIITTVYTLFATIDLEESKQKVKQQFSVAAGVCLMDMAIVLFLTTKINVYLALILGESVGSVAYAFLMRYLTEEEPKKSEKTVESEEIDEPDDSEYIDSDNAEENCTSSLESEDEDSEYDENDE